MGVGVWGEGCVEVWGEGRDLCFLFFDSFSFSLVRFFCILVGSGIVFNGYLWLVMVCFGCV